MSDRELPGFDVGTITEAVRQPPLNELRSTARSRRHRSVGMAAALVALAGVAVVPLLGGSGRTYPAAPVELSPRAEQSGDFTLTGPDSGVEVRRDGCTLRFNFTDDRGRSWSDRGAAEYRSTGCGASPTSTVGELAVTILGDRSYLVRDTGSLRLSTDYGRTWRDATAAIVAVPSFPATTQPVYCGFGCGAVQEPLAVDRSTGAVYRLTGDAPSGRPLFSLYPSPDGTLWATYQMSTNPRATVARSTDRGATWTTWEAGAGSTVLALVGIDQREGYLLTQASSEDASIALLRTTDGGKTWADTGAVLPTQPHWDLTAGSDGSLMAITAIGGAQSGRLAHLLVSRDDGRHFTVAREYGPLVGSGSVAPGYAWLFGQDDGASGGPDHVLLTTDATTWTRFALSP
ncbi:exo-alpha-sialidase [Micromonospora sp. STR1_7]|uniref:Exo-alpha-sialidase n=1 Tax=Micromonospora parastrephiae TaxID=2806101 RepID=A0ABS1XTM7_9ACTN|nr:exo-alpha-sialidase [Micromonospora parastrephiae]MBM0232609.1 exo-alpha-sialidase [Micromonospora parastrephiae]